jgi:AcrR family transcriptional regulator
MLHKSDDERYPSSDGTWRSAGCRRPYRRASLGCCGRTAHESAMPWRCCPRHAEDTSASGRYGGSLRFSRGRYGPADTMPLHKKRAGKKALAKNTFAKSTLSENTLSENTLDKTTPEKKASVDTEALRKPRADALRNRERVLEAARNVFSAGGPGASLEAVANAAGVGIGTLYRHFPTREALFDAVYRHEVQQLAAFAERLKKAAEPTEALRQWLHALVKFVATKKGMSAALALAISQDSDLFSYSSDLLMRSASELLDRATATGEIRNDISAEDLIRAMVGMCYTHDQPGWQKSVLRLVDVFIDGLRNRRTRRKMNTNRRASG